MLVSSGGCCARSPDSQTRLRKETDWAVSGLIRIWMRARMPILQKWVTQHERPYFCGGPARGADVAAWKQAYHAELAKAKRKEYVASLLGLVKAFDTVPFDVLIEHGVVLSCCFWILRLCILACSLGRVLFIDGCCSETVYATRGLAAGSITAIIELRLFLIVFADRMVAAALHTRLTIYVDDATLETVGHVGSLVADHVKSVAAFAAGIIDAGMQFSDRKNVCTASRASIAREIIRQVSIIKIRPARDVVSLGTVFAAGTRRTTKKTKARIRAFLNRRSRFKALSRAKVSVARVLRTGGTCALTYGNRPLGVSDSLLLARSAGLLRPPLARTTAGPSLIFPLSLLMLGPSRRMWVLQSCGPVLSSNAG